MEEKVRKTAMKSGYAAALCTLAALLLPSTGSAQEKAVLEAGHPSLKAWRLPAQAPHPADNAPTPQRLELGKKLFFDPRLSRDGNMSCATCHNPVLGWSDGLGTAKGFKSMVLGRATPTILNTGYNTVQMWDGRKATLEEQAMGPMEATVEMNMDIAQMFRWLNQNAQYVALFEKAYPGAGINAGTLSKAIAAFERTVVSNDSPFDRWVAGDKKAMSAQQVRGFGLFLGKGNCAACHSGSNFTDNGFHNVGLASYGKPDPDMGRYAQRPVAVNKGAFKTPTLRDVERTAPYFHDGSAKTLTDVIVHYDRGGLVKEGISPNIKPLELSQQERDDLVAFMKALTSPYSPVTLPELPQD